MGLNILVTGGAGYIGSHTILELLQAGHTVTALDNLSNSSRESLVRVAKISGRTASFIEGDIRDGNLVRSLLVKDNIDAVMHFAGLKAVGESVQNPLHYYENNVLGSIKLFEAMQTAGVFRLVFSSSATVYGDVATMPIKETTPTGKPSNPYGWSKLMVENCLHDLAKADTRWKIAILRYFNPAGAHFSGLIGENPRGTPNNLLPYISQVAAGIRTHLQIFGNDYPTPDGTGIRDYIHVVDLAHGHLRALRAQAEFSGVRTWNLGTGRGTSVLEAIHAFEQASHKTVPFQFFPRRAGDVSECWADPSKARQELGWSAQRDISEIMIDAWRWQSTNPYGYASIEG